MSKEHVFDLQMFAEDADTGTDSDKDAGVEETDNNTSDKTEKTKGKDEGKTFTQDELDEIIAKRLERERKKYVGFDDLKKKVEEYEKAIEKKKLEDMSEKERAEEIAKKAEEEKAKLAEQLELLQKQVKQEKITNEFIKLATANNIAYIDDALKLADLSGVEVDEDGKVEGVEDAVKALVADKPFLLRAKKDPKQIGGASSKNDGVDDAKTLEQQYEEAKKNKDFNLVIELSNKLKNLKK